MEDFGGYHQYLSTLPRQPAFKNNYWSAMLAYDMEECNTSDGFKIPYSVVEKELSDEDKNVNLPDSEAHISTILRHWLVHLLKAYDPNVNVLNLEEVLRSFVHNGITLPTGLTAFHLSRTTLFHSLPSECKLWLIYMIRTYKKPSQALPMIKRDALGNGYHIISDCRLYVSKEGAVIGTLPIDDERLKNQPWGPLYRFVHSQPPYTLLCDNRERWADVWDVFQHFKLNDLSNSIRQEINNRLAPTPKNHLMATIREKNGREFQEFSNTLASISVAEILESLSKNAKKKQQKKTSIDSHPSNTSLNTLETEVKSMNLKASSLNTTADQVKTSDEIMDKCWNFPQCPLKNKCKYNHPRIPCTKFPNCPRGWQCLFLHKPCPKDGQCVDVNCAFEHWKSLPTYHRIPRELETAKVPRPVASVAPVVRGGQKQNENKASNEHRAPITPSKQDGKERCRFFPRCKKVHTDKFFHPTEKCKTMASRGKCPDGNRCFFVHDACPNDGKCEDLECIYEHYKSPPVYARILASKKGSNPGQLSRVPSTGNLSTCSGMSRIRRKSVSFDDLDDEKNLAKKESTGSKPKGILKTKGKDATEICPFGARCSMQQKCDKAHPTKKCKAFPKCPNGGICMFVHDTCKNDGVCRKENCAFLHKLPHHISNSWCKNGSRCKRDDCKFIHPEECVGRCSNPGDCWKYHRSADNKTAAAAPKPPPTVAKAAKKVGKAQPPSVTPRRTAPQQNRGPGNNSGPSGPSGPGPQGAQMFPPPPGAPFPYGMPGYGPGMEPGGYGPHPLFGAPGMGPHGYGPYPGYGPAGPYGPPPGQNPASPPAATRRDEPPPPYLTQEERELLERKREESIRS